MKRRYYYIPTARRKEIEWEMYPLRFSWTLSRARDTYGQNVCTLRTDHKISSCIGGGQDISAVCLGDWIQQTFPEDLKRLKSENFKGLIFFDERAKKKRKYYRPGNRLLVDGRFGFEAMEEILKALGFRLSRACTKVNEQTYLLIAL